MLNSLCARILNTTNSKFGTIQVDVFKGIVKGVVQEAWGSIV
jgi:hypothetical protein